MSKLRIYGAVALSMIFWSFSFIWFKLANQTFSPLVIIFFRLVLAVIILSIYLFITRRFERIKKADRMKFLILALFEPFFYFLGESHGMAYVSSTTGSVIISTIPVIAAIGAWLFLGEKLRLINYLGIILSFAGILVFILTPGSSLSISMKGLALLGLAVVSATGYNFTLSRLVGSYSPVYIVNVQNIIGMILFLPLFIVFEAGSLNANQISIKSLLPIIELAIFASCGAFILFGFSVRHLGISKANAFTNIIPLFTAFFAFFFYNEDLSLQNLAGTAIVVFGLFLSQAEKKTKNLDNALMLTGKTA